MRQITAQYLRRENMIWTEKDIHDFITQVAPPNEELSGFDDRYLYNDAIKIAESQGADGRQLLAELLKMQKNSENNVRVKLNR